MSMSEGPAKFELVTSSTATQRAVDAILIAARTEAAIMLLAEIGTEVDLLARFAHDHSAHRKHTFLSISCPSLTDLPAEILSKANGGTIFFEEVGKLVPGLQVKLVHLLESHSTKEPTIRVISASRRDLVEEVKTGNFRNDLFFRLNVVEIRVPPLRERREDILPLTRGLVTSLSAELGRRVPSLSEDAEAMLLQHSWPGNLRELKNLVERALLIWPGDVLKTEAFTEIKGADVFGRLRAR